MNLETLKKLVALANKNPNENEANSAARRVCRMLEEGNFQLNGSSAPQQNNASWQKSPTSYSDIMEMFRQKQKQYEDEIFGQQTRQSRPPVSEPYDWQGYSPYYKQRTERHSEKRKCTKCGLEVKTFRLNEPPEKWVCNPCLWKDLI